MPLASLTTARIDALYRQLERGGRADRKAGERLSPRTVRYVRTILSAALAAAVRSHRRTPQPGGYRLAAERQAGLAPEMHPWDAVQLARDDAPVFGDHEGRHLHPERLTRTFHAEFPRAARHSAPTSCQ